MTIPVASQLLAVLVCPRCRGALDEQGTTSLRCTKCGLRYPVRDGIPIMLVEEATPS